MENSGLQHTVYSSQLFQCYNNYKANFSVITAVCCWQSTVWYSLALQSKNRLCLYSVNAKFRVPTPLTTPSLILSLWIRIASR